jgi:hypothetical protein
MTTYPGHVRLDLPYEVHSTAIIGEVPGRAIKNRELWIG